MVGGRAFDLIAFFSEGKQLWGLIAMISTDINGPSTYTKGFGQEVKWVFVSDSKDIDNGLKHPK